LRLKIATKIDKKKTELYFSFPQKNFLTEKGNAHFPGTTKLVLFSRSGLPLHFLPPIRGSVYRSICSHSCAPVPKVRELTELAAGAILPPPEWYGMLCEPKMQAIQAKMTNCKANGIVNFNRRTVRQILPISLIAFFLSASYAYAADELLPPFGFRWNDSMARVEAVLHGAKAKIVSREKKESREIWTVEGLVHPGLRRTLFTFKQRALVAVELQYEYPDWSIERYNQRMGEIRKYFDEKYGTGKLVSRTRDTDTEVIQTLVGYQWMVGVTMLELFYFSAQHDSLIYRTISVDYKAL